VRPLITYEDWQAVRKFANGYYARTDWVVPTGFYIALGFGSFFAIFIGGFMGYIGIAICILCYAKLYARSERVEGCRDGWEYAQNYIAGSDTIFELADFWSSSKKDANQLDGATATISDTTPTIGDGLYVTLTASANGTQTIQRANQLDGDIPIIQRF